MGHCLLRVTALVTDTVPHVGQQQGRGSSCIGVDPCPRAELGAGLPSPRHVHQKEARSSVLLSNNAITAQRVWNRFCPFLNHLGHVVRSEDPKMCLSDHSPFSQSLRVTVSPVTPSPHIPTPTAGSAGQAPSPPSWSHQVRCGRACACTGSCLHMKVAVRSAGLYHLLYDLIWRVPQPPFPTLCMLGCQGPGLSLSALPGLSRQAVIP